MEELQNKQKSGKKIGRADWVFTMIALIVVLTFFFSPLTRENVAGFSFNPYRLPAMVLLNLTLSAYLCVCRRSSVQHFGFMLGSFLLWGYWLLLKSFVPVSVIEDKDFKSVFDILFLISLAAPFFASQCMRRYEKANSSN